MTDEIEQAVAQFAVGQEVDVGGSTYRLLRIDDHVRLDGSPTKVCTWTSACGVCGEAFEATSGANVGHMAKHCAAHRRPPAPGHELNRLRRWLDQLLAGTLNPESRPTLAQVDVAYERVREGLRKGRGR